VAGLPEKVQAKKLGLIVNPLAGIGGRVGLKGSDGSAVQRRALELGAVPEAASRTAQALEGLAPLREALELITYPGEMGEEVALACGWSPHVIGSITPGKTTAEDTRRAAMAMLEASVDLLLFAGGDGTARDIYGAVGENAPVLGIPAGVKIHSAVFGASPGNAGELALGFLQGRVRGLQPAEVMDIDEEAYRRGEMAARLHGYLRIPYRRQLLQGAKSASPPGEAASLDGIAAEVVGQMKAGWHTVLGPGTTTRAITDRLGLEKTLLGVDVVWDGGLVAADVNEAGLLALLKDGPAKIVVTPIGGQGYLFGRGNQQISWRVIELVGVRNVVTVSTPGKIHSLGGRPLWVDTGSRAVDESLRGYIKIFTGYREQIVYRVVC
jgi:predicted polyphosphate/ATP-dependent NAD kinase